MPRRESNKFKVRNDFYILTNGAKTEKNYFEALKAKRSIYSVHVKFVNADPIGLVEEAIPLLKTANQVWVVFDIDYTVVEGHLVGALELAEKHGVKVAYSNKSFEVWLISHFKRFLSRMAIGNYAGVLTTCLRNFGYEGEYDKADGKVIESYFIPRYREAVVNAKIVYQSFVKWHFDKCGGNPKLPIGEFDPSTTVFKLIEALKLRN